MTRLEFHVAGQPEAQAHDHVPRQLPDGRLITTKYLAPETKKWRACVLRTARRTAGFPKDPWTGAVRVTIEAFFARPQRLMHARAPEGPIRKNSKPDADNLTKAVLDALTPPRMKREDDAPPPTPEEITKHRRGYLWVDDCQVHLGPVDRFYAAKGFAPGVIVVAEIIEDESELFAAATEALQRG